MSFATVALLYTVVFVA